MPQKTSKDKGGAGIPIVSDMKELMDIQQGATLMKESKGCSAEKEIAEYLRKNGLIADKSIQDAEQAEIDRHRRYANYQNIRSFLDNYRKIRSVFQVFKEEFTQRVDQEDIGLAGSNASSDRGLFTRLSHRLELMAVSNERRMQRDYSPRIATGSFYEFAFESLEFGLKVLKKENQELYDLINFVYIEGDRRPTIKEALAKFGFAGSSSYYQKMERAQKRLTTLVFGYCLNKDELFNILVFLKQQTDDDNFPDF